MLDSIGIEINPVLSKKLGVWGGSSLGKRFCDKRQAQNIVLERLKEEQLAAVATGFEYPVARRGIHRRLQQAEEEARSCDPLFCTIAQTGQFFAAFIAAATCTRPRVGSSSCAPAWSQVSCLRQGHWECSAGVSVHRIFARWCIDLRGRITCVAKVECSVLLSVEFTIFSILIPVSAYG